MDPELNTEVRPALSMLGRLCMLLSAASVLLMALITTLEVLMRALLGTSIQVSNELGGYLLVSLAFFSFAVCQERNAFIQVDFLQNRLSPRARALSQVVFGVVCIAFCAILEFYLIRLVLRSYESGSISATLLYTPQWLPQLSMPLGMGAFILALLRTLLRDLRQLVGR